MSVAKGREGRAPKGNTNREITPRSGVKFCFQMQIKLFTVPITDSGALLEEVNRFLRSHKILEVENHLVSNQHGASWCFCIKYLGTSALPRFVEKQRIDYKSILNEDVFKIFSHLRELRKQIAKDDAVPAYAICTDQELADIAALPHVNEKTLKGVKGFGKKKFDKYGMKFIEWYHNTIQDEKSGESL